MRAQRTIYFDTHIEDHPGDAVLRFEALRDQLNHDDSSHVHFNASESESEWEKAVRLGKAKNRADYLKRLANQTNSEKKGEKIDNSPNAKKR
jgi:hypothetical protein